MTNPTYEQLSTMMNDDYLKFTLRFNRLRGSRLHAGKEKVMDEDGATHSFDLTWFKNTEELIAVEIEEELGTILPANFKLRKGTDRYLWMGNFTEKGMSDLLVYRGGIIEHLWRLHTGEAG